MQDGLPLLFEYLLPLLLTLPSPPPHNGEGERVDEGRMWEKGEDREYTYSSIYTYCCS